MLAAATTAACRRGQGPENGGGKNQRRGHDEGKNLGIETQFERMSAGNLIAHLFQKIVVFRMG